MSSVTFYQSGKIKKLQTFEQLMGRETKNAIRRGQNRLRKAVGDEFKARGVGASIFAKGFKKGGLKTILARERVIQRGGLYEMGLRIKGVAALVARGGRSAAHSIGQAGKLLANPAAGFFARGKVAHPGSQFQRDDFPGRALDKTKGAFRVEVEKAKAKVAEIVNRG